MVRLSSRFLGIFLTLAMASCAGRMAPLPSASGGLSPASSAIASEGAATYRYGLVPMVGRAVPAISADDLHYRGGVGGVGVTTGKEEVYLVFWGTQWGTQGTNSQGYATFSNDAQGMAVIEQEFFSGLGTGGELWSGVMTQYCQGVASGSTSCPGTAVHIKYPTGGALAGVWEDTSGLSPAESSGHQLAVEAEKAATHFGNTTQALNRNAQYVIISPTGTDPDGYLTGGFCAWHDYTGDSSLDGGGSASGPLMAFTNMPYITDVGADCGAGIVDGKNTDGITIVGGHEYAETITDQFPAGGWLANNGEETGDLCAWKQSGAGHMIDLTLSTGTFAVQGTWSNLAAKDVGACSTSHTIVK